MSSMPPDALHGRNRTGIRASPIDAAELREHMGVVPAHAARPQLTSAALRRQAMADGDTVGSVPPATSAKGRIAAAAQALTGHRIHVLLDKLGERAAFERSGVRLYEAMLQKLEHFDRLPGDMRVPLLREMRDDEAAHFLLLAGAIESLGGDSTAQTPGADVAGVHGLGLMRAMQDPRSTLGQCLQTLLAAELIDHASWQLLIELANGFSQDELVADFRHALATEQRHEARVREWLAIELSAIAHVRH